MNWTPSTHSNDPFNRFKHTQKDEIAQGFESKQWIDFFLFYGEMSVENRMRLRMIKKFWHQFIFAKKKQKKKEIQMFHHLFWSIMGTAKNLMKTPLLNFSNHFFPLRYEEIVYDCKNEKKKQYTIPKNVNIQSVKFHSQIIKINKICTHSIEFEKWKTNTIYKNEKKNMFFLGEFFRWIKKKSWTYQILLVSFSVLSSYCLPHRVTYEPKKSIYNT